ncbi:MAG: hypothetical protein HYR88_17895 [Verrucomicrobia bacterium]|nr:hypothetical protein [Verrucomicrobiota bacterium]MBI3868800.1 hypothetical protein [Verrucomicrobiota bacterium]
MTSARSSSSELIQALREHQELARQILDLVEEETQALGATDALPASTTAAKQRLLPRLNASLLQLRQHRIAWQRLPPEEKARTPEISSELRSTQELLMKAILRDRENESRLLRAGKVPARHLAKVQPSATSHFVAHLYAKH